MVAALMAGACGAEDDPSREATGSLSRPGDPVDTLTLHRALVALNSCFWDDGLYRTLTGFRGKQGGYQYPPLPVSCLASVSDGCRGVARCMGFELRSTPGTPGCNGNIADFGNGLWDCERVGYTCRDGRCVSPDSEACDEGTFEESCESGGRPTHCDDQVHRGPACDDLGLSCVVDLGTALCRGTGEACTAESYSSSLDVDPIGVSCESTGVLAACVAGALAQVDCAQMGDGFRCQQAADVFFCGLSDECDPRSFGQQCDGDTVVFCDAGRVSRVDCRSLGFPGCAGTSGMACEGAETL